MPPERHAWALHPVVKDDTFWDNVAKGFTEAGTPFEDRSSNSSVETDGYQTLYPDNNEGKGVVISPRSILRMRVEKEEMPYCAMHFMSMTHQHEKFEAWTKEILGQQGMPKKFLDLES